MDRGNRILFAVLGAVLLLAGLAVGLAGLGLVPAVDPATRVLSTALRNRWHGWGTAAWLGTAGVGVLLAACGVLLARAQLVSGRGHPMPDLLLTDPALARPAAGTTPGHTRVRAAALVHSIERDLARHPKVRRATVLLAGDAAEPRVYARLELRAGAEVPKVQAYLSESLARFTGTTGLAPADVDVVVQLTDRDQVRVR